MNSFWILAQKDGGGISSKELTSDDQTTSTLAPDAPVDPCEVGGGAPGKLFGGNMQYIFLALMFVMMYLILFRGPRKKQQQHKKMVQTLTKNDKIRTIGGIIGTVVDVKGDEVILKIDESNNTKIRLSASAIGKNLSKDDN